jgi:hypothetical protein
MGMQVVLQAMAITRSCNQQQKLVTDNYDVITAASVTLKPTNNAFFLSYLRGSIPSILTQQKLALSLLLPPISSFGETRACCQ